MSYEEDIAWGVQQMLDADLQFPQDVPVRNVVKTNADHIRSMTDEELAELLENLSACNRCRRYGNDCFPVWDALDWLKQPYGGDT